MRELVLSFLFLFYSVTAMAGQWPMVTDVKLEMLTATSWNYHITQRLIEIGSPADVIMPDKYLELTFRTVENDGRQNIATYAYASTSTNGTDTISKTAVDLFNSQGSQVNTIHISDNNHAPEYFNCIGYIVYPKNGDSAWSEAYVPGGCMRIPPAQDWCKITTPELVFEHGSITLQQAEGDSAKTNVGIQCTTPTAVTFNLITEDKYVYLDEGKSEIMVDEKPLNTAINLPKGNSMLPIKDMLTGVTSEGFHTGSSVLVMMPY